MKENRHLLLIRIILTSMLIIYSMSALGDGISTSTQAIVNKLETKKDTVKYETGITVFTMPADVRVCLNTSTPDDELRRIYVIGDSSVVRVRNGLNHPYKELIRQSADVKHLIFGNYLESIRFSYGGRFYRIDLFKEFNECYEYECMNSEDVQIAENILNSMYSPVTVVLE